MLLPPDKNIPSPRGIEAQIIVEWGARVFPGKPAAKTPAIAGWPERATTDSAVVSQWWLTKDFNVCVATGLITSGRLKGRYLVVVDYDMKPGQKGAEALLAHELKGLSNTVGVRTPNGVHKYYWSRVPIQNSVSRIAPNVDVRGERGYVLGAMSIVGGVLYTREGEYSEIAELPAEFATLCQTKINGSGNGHSLGHALEHSKAPIGELDHPAAIESGKRYLINDAPEAIEGSHGDATTFAVAARCKDLGLSEQTTLELMLAWWNDEKAIPPWAFDALRTKVANAYQYGRNPPGSADPRNEFDVGNGEGDSTQNQQDEVKAIPLRSAFPIDPRTIPPRDWIVPGLLLKRSITFLVAPPGVGKSLLTLQIAIMVATGMSWGGWNPRKQVKTLVINAEDDLDEMQRRLCAAAQEMGVDQGVLAGHVFLADAPESIVVAKLKASTRTLIQTPLVERLVKTIKDNGISCVVVDPFAETFEGDENSNSEVKWAAMIWREVCKRTNCALVLVHHSRKYADDMAGEADVTRGGGSLIGVARILCTLFTMTEAEAKTMGVPVEERTDYVRFDDAKANHSKRGAVKWFSKKTLILENARDGIPGDEVGALAPWKPDLMEGITEVVLKDLIETINAGILNEHNKPSGSFFVANAAGRNNDRWVGHVLVKTLGCDELKAKAILKDWSAKGWIETFKYTDAGQRREVYGVRCDAAKWPHGSAPQGGG